MHRWIADDDAFAALCERLVPARQIGLDTEFMRVRTFLPELALLQFAADGPVVLVDPLPLRSLEPLGAVLRSASPRKIMHSASEDLIALAPIARGPVAGLFDTQVAAAFAGLGHGVGYQRLVADLLGVQLEKSQTRSNWLARPLSEGQLGYAAADVAHLSLLHDALVERLDRRGTLAWCLDECDRIARIGADDAPPANPHWEFRNAFRWPLERQARLKRLLDWREGIARRFDKPRTWILDNPAVAGLVSEPPASLADLEQRMTGQRSLPRRERPALFELLHLPMSPEALAIAPIPEPLRGEDERRVDTLRDRVAARAAELDLPPALLAPRRLLEAMVRGQLPSELDGWRKDALAPVLAANG
jgi:ribonuclease D